MKTGILHGWLLDGSGSNIYVRELAAALARRGVETHVLCQEPHPERYREGYSVHVPPIGRDLMPVYVADTSYEGFESARPFAELAGGSRLERYLEEFSSGVERVCRDRGIEVLHANHVYPMPEVARRVGERLKIPFLVFPHGSAIEYALKRAPELAAAARGAIDAAAALVVGNETVTRRICRLYPDREQDWRAKHSIVPVGVDPSLFEPVGRAERRRSVEKLAAEPRPGGGKTEGMTRELLADVPADDAALLRAVEAGRGYDHKVPDADLAAKLRSVRWEEDKTLLYVGKLITGKGVQDLVAALPAILEKRSDTTVFIVGEGPFREPLELMLHALSEGDGDLLRRIVRLGAALEGGEASPLGGAAAYLDKLGAERLLELGKRTRPIEKVVFTGYLRHGLFRHLLPCADVEVLPSVVAEAYPLTLLEAISAGVLPVGSDFEGLGEGLELIGRRLDPAVARLMRVDPREEGRVASIADNVEGLLARDPDWREACRALAVEEYSWDRVAAGMEDVYAGLIASTKRA